MPASRAQLTGMLARFDPGSRVLSHRTLTGGLSAEMTAFGIESADGSRQQLVLRRSRVPDERRTSSSIADEFRLVAALYGLGLPVPAPRFLDDSLASFDRVGAVYEWVAGAPRFSPADPAATGRAFAAQLAAIHQVRPDALGDVLLPARQQAVEHWLANAAGQAGDDLQAGRIREVLGRNWPPRAPAGGPALLHCDFWAGNVLWRDGRIVAVIDWEDASAGDPLADVATTRLDLLWAFGPAAMTEFTSHYLRLAGRDGGDGGGLAVWDLAAALRSAGQLSAWGADWATFGRHDVTETVLRDRHQWFAGRALAILGPAG